MTEENNTEEEIIENNNQIPQENEETEQSQVPIITGVDQVEPISVLELFERALLLLHLNSEDDNSKLYMDELYRKHFGNNYTPEDVNSGIADERQQAVVTDYIRDRLDFAKNMSTSLNKKKIDKAFENIFSLVGLNINISNSVEDLYDDIFVKRAGPNVFLLEDYEVMKLNRQAWHIYNEKCNITELSGLVTAMEDLEISIDDKNNQDFKIVSKEHLAQFYYNVSEIYESEANRKSNMPDINKWHYRAMEYKKKALDDYNPQKIVEACDRIIGNREASDRDKFRAHRLCANTLVNQQKIDGFVGKDERIDSAIEHYRNALAYVSNRDDRIDILNSISKAQKNHNRQDFVSTRLEIAELLEGRPRINEYVKLTDYAEDNDFKATLLKSCINEFHELEEIDIEDRSLYDTIDKKLRKILPPDDTKTLKTLDRLKKKFGTHKQKSDGLLFPMMSSKGHDYFNK